MELVPTVGMSRWPSAKNMNIDTSFMSTAFAMAIAFAIMILIFAWLRHCCYRQTAALTPDDAESIS